MDVSKRDKEAVTERPASDSQSFNFPRWNQKSEPALPTRRNYAQLIKSRAREENRRRVKSQNVTEGYFPLLQSIHFQTVFLLLALLWAHSLSEVVTILSLLITKKAARVKVMPSGKKQKVDIPHNSKTERGIGTVKNHQDDIACNIRSEL